ncbi:hypothetical protein QYM36_018781 [Artemia franciscana]|uniref:Uncharacterized protein n=1 Tax=Artemia franciscana TaxID=6661 RepID=A0AA88KTL4_ARTSF|nr:hypothetical protein QYM36_018781 [Artemia franciscana]
MLAKKPTNFIRRNKSTIRSDSLLKNKMESRTHLEKNTYAFYRKAMDNVIEKVKPEAQRVGLEMSDLQELLVLWDFTLDEEMKNKKNEGEKEKDDNKRRKRCITTKNTRKDKTLSVNTEGRIKVEMSVLPKCSGETAKVLEFMVPLSFFKYKFYPYDSEEILSAMLDSEEILEILAMADVKVQQAYLEKYIDLKIKEFLQNKAEYITKINEYKKRKSIKNGQCTRNGIEETNKCVGTNDGFNNIKNEDQLSFSKLHDSNTLDLYSGICSDSGTGSSSDDSTVISNKENDILNEYEYADTKSEASSQNAGTLDPSSDKNFDVDDRLSDPMSSDSKFDISEDFDNTTDKAIERSSDCNLNASDDQNTGIGNPLNQTTARRFDYFNKICYPNAPIGHSSNLKQSERYTSSNNYNFATVGLSSKDLNRSTYSTFAQLDGTLDSSSDQDVDFDDTLSDSVSSDSEFDMSEDYDNIYDREIGRSSDYNLNENDDYSDDMNTPDKFETENSIVCKISKIKKVKNKWDFTLYNIVLHIDGHDYVFKEADGTGIFEDRFG